VNDTPCRIILLNPPAPRPVFRDAYCSGPAKAPLLVHPLDLQVQSGFFLAPPFRLEFLDAVMASLSDSVCLDRVRALRPDVVLALVGSHSLTSDAAFFRRLKEAVPSARLYLTGDLALFDPEALWRAVPGASGFLQDFSSPVLRDHLLGDTTSGPLLLCPPNARRRKVRPRAAKPLDIPLPSPRVVLQHPYQLPFFSQPRFYSILSSYGCPFTCRYCNAHLVGYRERSVSSFVDELKVAYALGFRSLYVRDPTFMANRARTLELFRAWDDAGVAFEWMCFTRPDLLDSDVVSNAARLGCRVMMIGVESSNEGWLRDMGRKTALPGVRETFRRLRQAGIQTAAQVMVGMDDDTGLAGTRYEAQLLDFLVDLDPDYVSLNVFSRRPGLQVDHPRLTQVENHQAKYQALASRVNRAFYFRPLPVARRLLGLRLRHVPLLARVAYQLASG
jgi:hypothetical protein